MFTRFELGMSAYLRRMKSMTCSRTAYFQHPLYGEAHYPIDDSYNQTYVFDTDILDMNPADGRNGFSRHVAMRTTQPTRFIRGLAAEPPIECDSTQRIMSKGISESSTGVLAHLGEYRSTRLSELAFLAGPAPRLADRGCGYLWNHACRLGRRHRTYRGPGCRRTPSAVPSRTAVRDRA